MVQQSSTTHFARPSKANGGNRNAYMVGGGIGSLAAAAFMIRDGGIPGRNITIYEAMPVLGGSLDGGGNPTDGYTLRGGWTIWTARTNCSDSALPLPQAQNTELVYDDEYYNYSYSNENKDK